MHEVPGTGCLSEKLACSEAENVGGRSDRARRGSWGGGDKERPESYSDQMTCRPAPPNIPHPFPGSRASEWGWLRGLSRRASPLNLGGSWAHHRPLPSSRASWGLVQWDKGPSGKCWKWRREGFLQIFCSKSEPTTVVRVEGGWDWVPWRLKAEDMWIRGKRKCNV